MRWTRQVLSIMSAIAVAITITTAFADEKQETSSTLNQSEEVARQYLEAFRKSGIPTSKAVDAAVAKARAAGSIEAWTEAARIANSHANVVDVLTSHYSRLYSASRAGRSSGDFALINKAADYERVRNRYLRIRNDAYLELAKLYLAKGDSLNALSYVTTAVKLSGVEPNSPGEELIKQIIEYAP